MKCPSCFEEVKNENINIGADIAQCQKCKEVFKISENLGNQLDKDFNINEPPEGAWIKNEMHNLIIGASTRSAIAYFMVPFMLIWSGGSIGGIYGSQIISGKFDLMLSLFGIPFLLGSILFWALTFMAIWGKVEITFTRQGGTIFTGVGNIGLKKVFLWENVTSINEGKSKSKYPGNQGGIILIKEKKTITLGLGLNETRRLYMYQALKTVEQKVKKKGRII